jgi:hypothetical protein
VNSLPRERKRARINELIVVRFGTGHVRINQQSTTSGRNKA